MATTKVGKGELTNLIKERTGTPASAIATILDALAAEVAAQLGEGTSVYLPGIGTWSVAETKARKGVHPRTGEAMDIPAGQRVKFAAARGLRGVVKETTE